MRPGCLTLLLGLLGTVFGIASWAAGAEVSSPRHEVIAADRNQIYRFNPQGEVVWTFSLNSPLHCFQLLPNGNLLAQRKFQELVEIAPDGEIVWSYNSAVENGNAGRKLEVHTFERLPNGNTLVVENGIGRVIEITPAKQIARQFPYQVTKLNPHRDVRRAHMLKNGNVLICHEADGRVVEYDPKGKIVWTYDVPLFGKLPQGGHGPEAWGNAVYNALRLPNGHTLIATGNGHSVLEVNSTGEILWQVHQDDLPGIRLAWTTSLEVLPDGNVIIGNCHAGPNQPQLIEVNRNKEIVWTFHDNTVLGNDTAASATIGEETLR